MTSFLHWVQIDASAAAKAEQALNGDLEGEVRDEIGFMAIHHAFAIQGVGNWIEWVWWKTWGGFPSRRVLSGDLISADQHKRVVEALRKNGKVTTDASSCSLSECLAIVREVYSVVAAAGKAARVDTFNGNYGLLRGLAACFLVLLIAATVLGKGIYVVGTLVLLLLLALQRMHRFGKHYALELFIQYLLVVDHRPRKAGRPPATIDGLTP
jgi:PIN domain nuclease of toxin-antitoxin system